MPSEIEEIYYDYKKTHDDLRDYCIHEIKRGKDKPFSILILDFKTKGHIQFFKDLFYSSDWDSKRSSDGYLSNDMQFTIDLWKHLQMDKKYGPFDPSKIIEEYGYISTDKLYHPKLYRKSSDDVIDRLFNLQSI